MLSPLSLLFLLAIPVVVVLYLLRLRRKELVVSSTMLWPDMTQDIQANAPFQKLRKNILLFLQIAILALMAFALARPFLRLHARTSDNTVLILDASASMLSTDERGGRIEAAKRTAAKMIDDMSRNDRMMVIAAGPKPKVLSAFTTDRRALKAATASLKPSHGRADVRSAVVLGVSLMEAEQRGGRAAKEGDIFILSDGAFDPLDDLPIGPARLHFLKFGSRVDNVGITALDARQTYGAAAKEQIFVSVTNFAKSAKKVDVEMYHWDSLQRVIEMTIPPGETRSYPWKDFQFDTGVVRAKLDVKDDLAVDNEAYAYLAPRRHLSVLLVTEANPFLEKMLNVKDVIELATVRPRAFASAEGYDIVVFDSFTPEQLIPGAYLLVNAGAAEAPVTTQGRVRNPVVVDLHPHPVTKYVNFAGTIITEAKLARAKPWGKVLVEAGSTPLVVVGERAGIKCVYVGFPLNLPKTNFVLRVGFPIFISNIIEWLGRDATGRENIQARAGGVVQLQAPERGTELMVEKPSGEKVRVVAAEGESSVAFDDTDEVGVYRTVAPEDGQVFVVNLLSRTESNTAPVENISFGRKTLAAANAAATANREIWRVLALVGLLVLMVEWYIYHRRF